jgi:hypothetical protein
MRIDEASKDRQDQSAQVIASNEKTEISLETHRIYRVGLAYGRLVYRFRWFVLAFWLIVLVASVPFASKLPAILSSGGYCSDFHTQRMQTHVHTEFRCSCFIRRCLRAEALWSYPASAGKFASSSEPVPETA